jgi:penicillin amidase
MIIALIVVAAVVVVLCAALLVARHRTFGVSLPQVRGRLGVAGLAAAVTVGRDRWGVPHVNATSMEDAAFAMGVVHAQDRLWQMEVNRRVATGRISELVGTDGVNIDRFIRRVGLHRVARDEELRLAPEARRMLKAYAAGVNAIAQSGRALPLEYRLLGATPEPWEPMHSLATLKLLALGLSMNWDTELQRLELLRAIGPEHAARLDIVYPDANPTILASTVKATGGSDTRSQLLTMFREAARWIPTAGGMSNAWVVSGERTSTGRPILCNDPHLVPGMPSIWYAAHVRAGEDFESTGVTMPGMPFVIIGHNKRVAWGFTNSFADCQDLVIEEFDSPAADRFRTERGFEATRRLREIIHVKGASDELEEVVITRHGPVVERIEDPERSIWRGLALQWTALQPGGAAEGLLRLQRAGDWKSFKEAFAPFDAPSQNVVYADVERTAGPGLDRGCGVDALPDPGRGAAALRSSRTPDHHRQQPNRRGELPLLHRHRLHVGVSRAADRRAPRRTRRRPCVHGPRADGPRLPTRPPGGSVARRDALRASRSRSCSPSPRLMGCGHGLAPGRTDGL